MIEIIQTKALAFGLALCYFDRVHIGSLIIGEMLISLSVKDN